MFRQYLHDAKESNADKMFIFKLPFETSQNVDVLKHGFVFAYKVPQKGSVIATAYFPSGAREDSGLVELDIKKLVESRFSDDKKSVNLHVYEVYEDGQHRQGVLSEENFEPLVIKTSASNKKPAKSKSSRSRGGASSATASEEDADGSTFEKPGTKAFKNKEADLKLEPMSKKSDDEKTDAKNYVRDLGGEAFEVALNDILPGNGGNQLQEDGNQRNINHDGDLYVRERHLPEFFATRLQRAAVDDQIHRKDKLVKMCFNNWYFLFAKFLQFQLYLAVFLSMISNDFSS